MNIKSISELDLKEVSLSKLSADPNAAIEVDFKQVDGSFKSEKFPIGLYTGQIISELYAQGNVIDGMIAQFKEKLNELMHTIDISVQYMYDKFQAFIISSHNEFVHKTIGWKDSNENIYGGIDSHNRHCSKDFYNEVYISGDFSTLCADTIIEGATRKTEYYT